MSQSVEYTDDSPKYALTHVDFLSALRSFFTAVEFFFFKSISQSDCSFFNNEIFCLFNLIPKIFLEYFYVTNIVLHMWVDR